MITNEEFLRAVSDIRYRLKVDDMMRLRLKAKARGKGR